MNAYQRSVLALKLDEIITANAKKKHDDTIPKIGQKGFQVANVVQNSEPHKKMDDKVIGKLAKMAKVSHHTIAKVKVIEEKDLSK